MRYDEGAPGRGEGEKKGKEEKGCLAALRRGKGWGRDGDNTAAKPKTARGSRHSNDATLSLEKSIA